MAANVLPGPSPGRATPLKSGQSAGAETASLARGLRRTEPVAINPQIMFRADPDTRDAITAAQQAAGDRSTAATVRRLVLRGLALGPVYSPPEIERLAGVERQLAYLGNNLNQLLRQAYMRDVATGFDWPALETTAKELGQTAQELRRALKAQQ